MERWIPIFLIICISVVGFIKLVFDYRSLVLKNDFTLEFINKYRDWGNELLQNNMKEEIYQWLKMKSSKMQLMMGFYGIASVFQPPYSNVVYKNYQIILNGLSEIRKEYTSCRSMGFGISYDNLHELIRMIDDCLISYMGALNDLEENMKSEIKNPTIWFREGIRFVVVLPISFIYWSGLINYRVYSKISNNLLIKIVTLMVGIIGFISSVVTLVSGYDSLINIYDNLKGLF